MFLSLRKKPRQENTRVQFKPQTKRKKNTKSERKKIRKESMCDFTRLNHTIMSECYIKTSTLKKNLTTIIL